MLPQRRKRATSVTSKKKKEKRKSDLRREQNKEKYDFKTLFMYLDAGGAGCQMSEGLIRKQRPH